MEEEVASAFYGLKIKGIFCQGLVSVSYKHGICHVHKYA